MRQIRNRTMSVLEVEGIEKLLRLLLVDLLQRLLHGQRRTRILRHGIGLDLRLHAVHSKNLYAWRIRGLDVAVGRTGRDDDFRHAEW